MSDEFFVTVANTQLVKPIVMVRPDKSVWLVIQLRWWDLATLIWWFFHPGYMRARVTMKLGDQGQVGLRCHSIRIADDIYNSTR